MKLVALFAITFSLIPSVHAADAFRCKGANGETIFSDTPCGDGKAVELKEVPTMEMKQVQPLPPLKKNEKKERENYEIAFLSPLPEEPVRDNEGKVTVTIKLTPELGPDSTIQLKVNGQDHGSRGRGTTWSLTGMERGMHTITVEVVNYEGKVVSSASTSFVLHKATANRTSANTPVKQAAPLALNPMPGDPNFVEPMREPGHEWAPAAEGEKKDAPNRGPRK